MKALSCTIPIISGLTTIEFFNNSIPDEMSAVLIFASYMNPDLKNIRIRNNLIRGTAARSYLEFCKVYAEKIVEIDLQNSIL